MNREYSQEEIRALADKNWTEAKFQDQVIEFAHLHGWKVAHFRRVRIQRANGSCYYQTPVQADGAGFVDLLLCRDRVVYMELKKPGGRLEPEQKLWRDILKAAGAEWYCFKPADWEELARVLS